MASKVLTRMNLLLEGSLIEKFDSTLSTWKSLYNVYINTYLIIKPIHSSLRSESKNKINEYPRYNIFNKQLF